MQKRLNYATQALDDFARNRTLIGHLGADAGLLEDLGRLIREGQKFLLPDKGTLLFGEGGIPKGIERSRLPYPVTVIETTWDYGGNASAAMEATDFETVANSRRLVLAFEVDGRATEYAMTADGDLVPDSVLACAPEPGGRIDEPTGYVVCAIAWVDAARLWLPSSMALYVPYDQTQAMEQIANQPSMSWGESQKRMDEYRRSTGVDVLPFNKQADVAMSLVSLLPATAQGHYGKHDAQAKVDMIINDVGEEGRMITELGIALSCSNVTTDVNTPSKLQQSERRRARKAPLFDYHVLMVTGRNGAKTESGGTHASPRTHLRRGHLRRLPHREERIWINDTMVNPGNGFAAKDYAVARS